MRSLVLTSVRIGLSLAICGLALVLVRGDFDLTDGGSYRSVGDPSPRRLADAGELARASDAVQDLVGDDARLHHLELRLGRMDWAVARPGGEPLEVVTTLHRPADPRPSRFAAGVVGAATGKTFPVAEVRPSVPGRTIALIERREGAAFVPSVVELEHHPATGKLRWQFMGTAGGKPVAYTSRADGTGVRTTVEQHEVDSREVLETAEAVTPSPARPATPGPASSARELGECMREAVGDVAAVQACAAEHGAG